MTRLEPPPNRVEPTIQFRSTWIVASQNALRDCGFFDRYTRLLPEVYRDQLLTGVVGVWLPMHVAIAHYTTCDRLGLSEAEMASLGRILPRHPANMFRTVAGHLAKQVGATPWLPILSAPRMWGHVCVGGGLAVHKEGPKDARLELLECALGHIPYFRAGFMAIAEGLCRPFCDVMYVKQVPSRDPPTATASFRLSWV
ncbi:hypothetical protein [Pendulispora albinea]|uniref:Uncharacterized protein n=1 Tax=Pendulispora albinea TaxID=2741071 RepID=A0ABZ2MA36_9BACT